MRISKKKRNELLRVVQDCVYDHTALNYPRLISDAPEMWSEEDKRWFDSMAALEFCITSGIRKVIDSN